MHFKGQELTNSFPLIEKYIFSKIIEAEQSESCSYVNILTDILNLPMEFYFFFQKNGLLEFHNSFYQNKDFLNDFESDFSGKEDYFQLSNDNKKAVVSYLLNDYFDK